MNEVIKNEDSKEVKEAQNTSDSYIALQKQVEELKEKLAKAQHDAKLYENWQHDTNRELEKAKRILRAVGITVVTMTEGYV